MIAYVVLFALLFLLSYFEKTNIQFGIGEYVFNGKAIYGILVFTILSLFMGLRAESVGCDLVQYHYRYEYVAEIIQGGGKLMNEWGFNYLSYFFHDFLNLPFQFFVFFLSIITSFAVVFVLFRYTEDFLSSIIVFLTLGSFTMAMSGIRQYFAVSLLLISLIYCEKKKFIPFLFLCILAYSVHNSSLIFFISYFIWGIRLSKKNSFILLFIVLGTFAYKNLLGQIIMFITPQRYSDMDIFTTYNINFLVLAVPISMLLFSLFFLDYDQENKMSKKNSFFYLFSCLSLVMLILSMNNNQLGRLSYYFNIGTAIVVSSALVNQKRNDYKSASIVKALISILCLAYFFISTPGGTLKIDNYRMFFF